MSFYSGKEARSRCWAGEKHRGRPRGRGKSSGFQEMRDRKTKYMLNNTVVFLIIALIAAVLGFGAVAGTAALIAKICFVIFLVMFIASLVRGKSGKVR